MLLGELQAEGLLRPLMQVEMPLVHVLAQMEAVGIAVDPAIFSKHKARSHLPFPVLHILCAVRQCGNHGAYVIMVWLRLQGCSLCLAALYAANSPFLGPSLL
jgi:hypothetical protein